MAVLMSAIRVSLSSLSLLTARDTKRILDYSLQALFFSILGCVEHIISLATTLHELLAVRRADIFHYWDKLTKRLIEMIEEDWPEYVDALKESKILPRPSLAFGSSMSSVGRKTPLPKWIQTRPLSSEERKPFMIYALSAKAEQGIIDGEGA
ncbi:hypothetical protein B0I35DRAFT_415421 [Stachybotrys elegans]|uniref:Uncharacterized protein n=1 Tax=Stachybotrys elegans TaxID=80388 RepID=A0A8K0S7W1_9HYPO|nr:hypothetical protein B0I35DRAFT_415421 [Stachybotrys elegans]